MKMSRIAGWYQTQQVQEFSALAEFAYYTVRVDIGEVQESGDWAYDVGRFTVTAEVLNVGKDTLRAALAARV